jgi:hypothetical protein
LAIGEHSIATVNKTWRKYIDQSLARQIMIASPVLPQEVSERTRRCRRLLFL